LLTSLGCMVLRCFPGNGHYAITYERVFLEVRRVSARNLGNSRHIMFNNLILVLATAVIFLPISAFSAERTPSEEGKHLFILSGQSNMRAPLPEAFRESVSKVFGADRVIVVTVARPSQPINQWYKQWSPPEGVDAGKVKNIGSMYESLLNGVNRAIAGKELASVTFIWMQGEADAGNGWGSVYEKSFYGVLDQLKADLGVESINFVLGRINDHWLPEKGVVDGELVRGVQVEMAEEKANGDWVDTDDLNTGLNPWGIYEIDGGHFPTPAYRVLGQRFARKACILIDPDLQPDDDIFDAVFFDSSEDIRSHLAMGKGIKGTSPDPAHAGGEAGLSSLLDGKFGGTDAKEKAWLGFAPAEEKVSFEVDLGDSQGITEIGIDILFSKEAGATFAKTVNISTSVDGSEYRPVGKKGISFFYGRKQQDEWSKDAKPRSFFVLADMQQTDARYIRIEVEKENTWLFVDEIVVNPVAR
jgi:hypothetical protein